MKLLFGTMALLLSLPSSAATATSLIGARGASSSGVGLRQFPPLLERDRICLVHKATRNLECRSRAQWAHVAQRLSKRQSTGSHQ